MNMIKLLDSAIRVGNNPSIKRFMIEYGKKKALERISSSVSFESDDYSEYAQKYIEHLYKNRNRSGDCLIDWNIQNGKICIQSRMMPVNITFITDDYNICIVKKVTGDYPNDSGTMSFIKVTFVGRKAYYYTHNLMKYLKKAVSSSFLKNTKVLGASYDATGNRIYFPYKSFDEVIFKEKQDLIESLDNFMSNREFHMNYGIPYKLGILLYGEPGTGKSSAAKAIISYLSDYYDDINTYYLDLGASEERLSTRLSQIYSKSNDYEFINGKELQVVIIEEIDNILPKGRDSASDKVQENKINILLQFLDGPMSPNNTVIIATTNYKDKLDTALIRDGRFDVKMSFGFFEEQEAKTMCDKFDIDYSILNGVNYPISPSTLQKKIFNKKFRILNKSPRKKVLEIHSDCHKSLPFD